MTVFQSPCYWGNTDMDEKDYVLHESLAYGPYLFTQSSRKHHDLLLVRSQLENILDIFAHICNTKCISPSKQ
jgi:hypothetical protein